MGFVDTLGMRYERNGWVHECEEFIVGRGPVLLWELTDPGSAGWVVALGT